MNLEFLESTFTLRSLWAIVIIAAGLSLYWLFNRLILARAKTKALPSIGTRPKGSILLYFTTPSCVPCKTTQRPEINKVKEQLGENLQVIEIDAYAQPEIASQWGVLSVPTTFMIDANGQPRHVNHGVTSADKLLKQYQQIENH
jgi:thiol-disulfide isomerase/thioredoxin